VGLLPVFSKIETNSVPNTVTTSIALWVSLYVEAKQNIWIKAIQTRVTATASMLEAMKGVKMLGLTDVMSDIIQKLRVTELTLSKPFRLLLICNTILGKLQFFIWTEMMRLISI
jgi:hypothetical protein